MMRQNVNGHSSETLLSNEQQTVTKHEDAVHVKEQEFVTED